jgi:hypothetical protein
VVTRSPAAWLVNAWFVEPVTDLSGWLVALKVMVSVAVPFPV